jgi:chromosome partitioning protein
MAITISFGIQKGGVGKTTTTGITSYLLSKKYKVLAVDFDSQGNLTQFLTQQNIYDFTKKTVLEAIKEEDPRPYIHKINDKLHILPAEDLLVTFAKYLYTEYPGKEKESLLRNTLSIVKNDYDYICIDLPPNLGEQTLNALTASDFVVTLLQTEPFCYDALDRFLETLTLVQTKTNSQLRIAGILTTLLDSRTSIDTAILNQARSDYDDVVFNTIIKRKSKIKEFSLTGIADTLKSDRDALLMYKNFTKELIKRVKS